jgi:protein-S-isoprenylcysteine O-methyltransferase Ste14
MTVLIVFVTAFYTVVTKIITDNWPSWAYVLLVILALLVLAVIMVFFIKCDLFQNWEKDKIKELK